MLMRCVVQYAEMSIDSKYIPLSVRSKTLVKHKTVSGQWQGAGCDHDHAMGAACLSHDHLTVSLYCALLGNRIVVYRVTVTNLRCITTHCSSALCCGTLDCWTIVDRKRWDCMS